MDKQERLLKIVEYLNDGLTKEEFLKSFESMISLILNVQKKLTDDTSQLKDEFKLLSAKLALENSSDLDEIKSAARIAIGNAIESINTEVRNRLVVLEKRISLLKDGKDADEERMIAKLQSFIPTIDSILKMLPAYGAMFRDGLELLTGDDRLDESAIKGLDEREERLMRRIAEASKKGEPIKFVGGARGIYVYIGGSKKGIMNSMNFAAGTGMSIAYSKVNGLDTLTFNASGGGISVVTPTGSVNAVNAVFTVSAQPQWVVADGVTYYEGKGYSYAALQITMDVAPSFFIRAIL